MKHISFRTAALLLIAVLVGGLLDRIWLAGIVSTAIDTSSLTMVKDAIEKQNSTQFVAAYKTINMDPNATWPD